MQRLRRSHAHRVRRHHRFHIAVALTIVAVAVGLVPTVVDLMNAFARYDPQYYEPRDPERARWLDRRGVSAPLDLPLQDVLKIVLFVLAGIAWIAVGPGDRARRR